MSGPDGLDGVAIVGLAGRFPGAPDARAFWRNLAAGVESVTRASDAALRAAGVDPALLADPRYVRAVPVLDDADAFDAAFFGLSPREAETTDPQHRVFLECAWEALEDAGYGGPGGNRSVGLYAGVSFNSYVLASLAPRLRAGAFSELLQLLVGNDKDYLATRVSYKLDLRGPSMVVQTACSSSLVAVAQACQGLLNFQCDMALAGGVAVRAPRPVGYRYEEGGVLSRTGHCRAFDAAADGTIYGEGVGVVVLKRLEDAVADRDHVYAVIKGFGVNNDGSGKVGFAAPSVDGQAAAIAAAQAMADVAPDTVTLVEAHGTGTALGDPIEVAALTRAFRAGTKRRGYCALGSVKTNVGHLDGAAGITSLIKTALALAHRQLPPSLNFTAPNPQIDFAASPFFVNTALRDWDAPDGPRRAGVSSFGFGGTNAHVVLEEAPPAPARGRAGDGPHLLALSARSPEALRRLAARYGQRLAADPTLALADVCFTAAVGRAHFPHRVALAGDSPRALADQLARFADEGALARRADGSAAHRRLAALAERYERGGALDAAGLDPTATASRVSLPTYPFERQRYWVDPPLDTPRASPDAAPGAPPDAAPGASPERPAPPPVECYATAWREAAREEVTARAGEGTWLLFADGAGVAARLQRVLRQRGAAAVLVRAGRSRVVRAPDQWSIDPTDPEDYAWLREELARRGAADGCRVVFLWGLDAADEPAEHADPLAEQDLLCGGLVRVAQALGASARRMWVVTAGAVDVPGRARTIALQQAPLWGLGRVAALEYADRWGGLIDLDPAAALEASVAALAGELRDDAPADEIAWRDGRRFVARLARTTPAPATARATIASSATYLVTGGLGGLGLALARWLVAQGARSLVLAGRSAPTAAQRDAVERLRQAGCAVLTLQADVARPDDVARVLATIAASLPPLAGVFHLAGALTPATIPQTDWRETADVLGPKVAGAWHLHRATRALPLAHFVMFSSIAASAGAPGAASYASANAFLDGLAAHRRALGLPALSVGWSAWAGAGMAARALAGRAGAAPTGLPPIDVETGLARLGALLRADAHHVTVAAADWPAWCRHLGTRPPLLAELLADAPASRPAGAPAWQALAALPPDARRAALTENVRALVARLLGRPDALPDVDEGFTQLGLDSLLAVGLRNEIQAALGRELSATLMFNNPNIAALVEHLLPKLAEAARAPLPSPAVAPPTPTPTATPTPVGREPIAVVGIGCRFPGGVETPEDYWELLRRGVDATAEVPADRWDVDAYYDPDPRARGKTYVRRGAFLDGVDRFDPQFFGMSPRETTQLDPQQRLLLEVCWEALERAGYDPRGLAGRRVGVFAGAGPSEFALRQRAADPTQIDLYTGSGAVAAFGAGRISHVLGLQGPSLALDTACSSSLVAVHLACQSLRSGESEVALAGGVQVMLAPETNVYLARVGALARDGRCKTFDASADGYGRGEGCGVVVLKRLSDAVRDGDAVLAVIRGSAVNHDGVSAGLTVPNGRAQAQVIGLAVEDAGVAPDEVSYVEAHGTGTLLGDPIEVEALASVYGARRARPLLVGAVKTNLGHLEAAAGVAGLIKVVLALGRGELPRSLHFDHPNPHIPWADLPVSVVAAHAAWPEAPRIAGVSAFGMSGTNAHVIVAAAPPAPAAPPDDDVPRCFALSACSPAALRALARRHLDHVRAHPALRLADVCFTVNASRTRFAHRLAVCARSRADLGAQLAAFLADEPRATVFVGGPDDRGGADDGVDLARLPRPERALAAARRFANHLAVDWAALDDGRARTRLPLPTYPFERARHWPDALSPARPAPRAPGDEALADFTLAYLREVFGGALSLAPASLDSRATYETFGLDSMVGQEITSRLERDLGPLGRTLLFEQTTLAALRDHLAAHHRAALLALRDGQDMSRPAAPAVVTNATPARAAAPRSFAPEPIAIVGVSGRYPLAEDLDAFWENLRAGRDCVTTLPPERWRAEDYPVAGPGGVRTYDRGGFLPDVDRFDPLFFGVSPGEAAVLMDPQERLFLETAWATFEDAGYDRARFEALADNRVGVFVGATYNLYPLYVAEAWAKGERLPLTVQTYTLANRLSYFMDFRGPSLPVDTACSSSLAAVHLACEAIRRGECAMALAGGVNLSLHPAKYHTLAAGGFMSEQGRCASFAAGGAGYVPGEGVGAVLLKPLAHALRDGDRIHATILASAMNHDGKTSGFTVPNPNAQAELVATALARAGIDPRTVTCLEAHATGTALGDPIEVRGLQRAFARFTDATGFCALGSVKSNVGHLEAAAGIAQLTKVLLQLRHATLAPSIHADTLNPAIDFAATPFRVQRAVAPWHTPDGAPRRAGVSAFGAGGVNVHVIVEEHCPPPAARPSPAGPWVFVLSAQTPEVLRAYARRWRAWLDRAPDDPAARRRWLADACFTLQTGREPMAARLALVVDDAAALRAGLARYDDAPEAMVAAGHCRHDVRAPDRPAPPERTDPHALARHWLAGHPVAWASLDPTDAPRRVALPTYPFARRRCWVPGQSYFAEAPPPDLADWLYAETWAPLDAPPARDDGARLVFCDASVRDALGWRDATFAVPGASFGRVDDRTFALDPYAPEDYARLWDALGAPPATIVYWADASAGEAGARAWLRFFQALARCPWAARPALRVVTRGAQAVRPGDALDVWQRPLQAFVSVFALEQPGYRPRLLDLDPARTLDAQAAALDAALGDGDAHVALRDGAWHGLRLARRPTAAATRPWQAPDAALVTGGLGALGHEVAAWLVGRGTRHLLLVGSTALPPREDWARVTDARLRAKLDRLVDLEARGARVRYAAADVADRAALAAALASAEAAWSVAVDGVFHLAGVTTDSVPFAATDDALLARVLRPKTLGTLALHELLAGRALRAFVLFGSTSAVPHLGARGLAAYAAANAFLDGFARQRRAQGLPALAIDWTAWAEKGMGFEYQHAALLALLGMTPLPVADGLALLGRLLDEGAGDAVVVKVDWARFVALDEDLRRAPYLARVAPAPAAHTPSGARRSRAEIVALLADAAAAVLLLDPAELDAATPLQDYGLDSIAGLKLATRLAPALPGLMSPTDLYRCRTLAELAAAIDARQGAPPEAAARHAGAVDALLEAELAAAEALLDQVGVA